MPDARPWEKVREAHYFLLRRASVQRLTDAYGADESQWMAKLLLGLANDMQAADAAAWKHEGRPTPVVFADDSNDENHTWTAALALATAILEG